MSKITVISLSTLLLGFSLLATPALTIAQDSEQLSHQENAEAHRKIKPKIAEREGIRASLKALRKNGALQRASRQQAELTASNNRIAARAARQVTQENNTASTIEVVAIKHVLTCETKPNCQVAVEWATNNEFNTARVLSSEGHGGETMYHLFLRQAIAADEDTITNESNRVHEGIATLDGIRYATWMVDFDPEGLQDSEDN